MTAREAFERYMGGDPIILRRDSTDSHYVLLGVNVAWNTWQAACKYKDEQYETNEYFNEVSDSLRD